jgi:hypothetical protein
MKIPYGIANFAKIRSEGHFYVDKTPFLPILEDLGPSYLLFLRPRRMGKSLLVSMLEHYYDLDRVDQFDALFGGLWIHEHPTPERGRYLVLVLDFSGVGVDGDDAALRRSFLGAVRGPVEGFLLRYRARFPPLAHLYDQLDPIDDAATLIGRLASIVNALGQTLYLLIDEYDNFANRLLSAGADDVYTKLVERTGFVRTFYATLKMGTGSGAIGRIFITGVAPLLLDDLSSGFNIVTHISQDPELQTLTGFTHADVERGLDGVLAGRPEMASLRAFVDRDSLLSALEHYYDGYRFSPGASPRVFNSDMVLYFLQEAVRKRAFPRDMLDLNVRTDYRRLQHIGMLVGSARAERRALLEAIASEGTIQSPLEQQFGVRSLSSQTQFLSLLYYLGLLTIGPEEPDQPAEIFGYRLEIPNRVIRELIWEHLATMFTDEEHLDLDTRDLEVALVAMALRGDIEPFLDLFHTRVLSAIGLKDLRRFDEKAVKLMLLAFISLSRLFYPLSEKEFAQGYCDLFLGVSPLYPAAKHAWLLELKYLPAGASAKQIERAFQQAEEQVARYAGDAALVPLLTRGQALSAGSLVFVGAKRPLFRAWPAVPGEKQAGGEKKARARAKKTTTGGKPARRR